MVNVREGAGLSFPIVKKLTKGESYPILNEDGDWIEIRIGAGKTGWVANWLWRDKQGLIQIRLKRNPVKGQLSAAPSVSEQVPALHFKQLGPISKGTFVDIIEKNENWIKVKQRISKVGSLLTTKLTPASEMQQREIRS